MRQIALAIPTWERFEYLTQCVAYVLEDPRVGEIVVSDDSSADGSYEKLRNLFANHSKIRLFRNATNLDCYRNKKAAVERCSLPWVVLFDDDNVMPLSYLDCLFDIPEWEQDLVYCPEYAEPFFDYTAFSGSLITRSNVAGFMNRAHFATALNTANYFCYRHTYLDVWDPAIDPHTADSIYQAFRLLQAGKRMIIVPGLRYYHRVHDGSHYKKNVHKTGSFAAEVEKMIRGLR